MSYIFIKGLTILLLLMAQTAFGQDAKYIFVNHEFSKGEVAYMFGNDVKLRDQPNTSSNVITLLKIGNKIEILEKSDVIMEFDGIGSPWYKVQFQDKIGYVLGSFISLDRAIFDNLTYLISLKRDESKVYLKTRVLENSQFKENITQLLTEEFSIKSTGNRGLQNIESILEINYLAESCGVNGGGFYLFYNNQDLIKAFDYTIVHDADLYWCVENYIFPADKDGQEGKILFKREIGETKDYDTEWVEIVITHQTLEWKDNQIIPTPPRIH